MPDVLKPIEEVRILISHNYSKNLLKEPMKKWHEIKSLGLFGLTHLKVFTNFAAPKNWLKSVIDSLAQVG